MLVVVSDRNCLLGNVGERIRAFCRHYRSCEWIHLVHQLSDEQRHVIAAHRITRRESGVRSATGDASMSANWLMAVCDLSDRSPMSVKPASAGSEANSMPTFPARRAQEQRHVLAGNRHQRRIGGVRCAHGDPVIGDAVDVAGAGMVRLERPRNRTPERQSQALECRRR